MTAENGTWRYTGEVKRLRETRRYGYALFIALIPVLMMYKVPVVDRGLSTMLVAIAMPYAAFKAISARGRGGYQMVLPLVAYCGYMIFRSDGNTNNILLTVSVVVHLTAAASGAVSVSYARKVIEAVSILAAVGVIFQSIAYYLFHFHLPMIVGNWVLDAMQDSYRFVIDTGVSWTENIYRPSAFFLEPAHLSQYAIVGLISCLFRARPKYRTAVVMSLGILLSTSGMGLVLTVFSWGAHALRLRESNMIKSVSRFLLVVAAVLIAAALLSQSSIMQSSVARISGGLLGSTSEYNAIWGRTMYWKKYITPLTGNSLVWGMGFAARPDVYFTGLMEILFCYGYVGVGLFYLTVISIIIKTSGFGRWVAISVGGLMPIANLSSFLSLIYFFGILYAFLWQQKRKAPTDRRIPFITRRLKQYRGSRFRNIL